MASQHSIFDPQALAEFAFGDPKSQVLLDSIINGQVPFPMFGRSAICLYGTYGTGKTTLAKLLPGLLEAAGKLQPSGHGVSVFESTHYINFTSCSQGMKGSSVIQEITARSQSELGRSPSGWAYEILDEVDTLTAAAQASLKSLIVESTNAIFLLTTNNQQKLDPGLRDRSYMIEMNQPAPEQMLPLAINVLRKMGLKGDEIAESDILQAAKDSRGSMRDFMPAIVIRGAACGGSSLPRAQQDTALLTP